MRSICFSIFFSLFASSGFAQEDNAFARSYYFQIDKLHISSPRSSGEQFLSVHVDLIGRSNHRIRKGIDFPLGYLPVNQDIKNHKNLNIVVRSFELESILWERGLLDIIDSEGYDIVFSLVMDRVFVDETLLRMKIPLEELNQNKNRPKVLSGGHESQLVLEVIASDSSI